MTNGKRHIILTPGEPPRLEGGWTVGEIQQMAQLLMQWLSQLQVSQPQAQPDPAPRELVREQNGRE